jgi:hypothetical protein
MGKQSTRITHTKIHIQHEHQNAKKHHKTMTYYNVAKPAIVAIAICTDEEQSDLLVPV